MGAGALSLASMGLIAVGALQVVGSNGLQTFFLAAAMVLMVAVGLGATITRAAHGFKDGFESEEPYVIEPGS